MLIRAFNRRVKGSENIDITNKLSALGRTEMSHGAKRTLFKLHSFIRNQFTRYLARQNPKDLRNF